MSNGATGVAAAVLAMSVISGTPVTHAGLLSQTESDPHAVDDVQVLTSVIDHTIRPEVIRLHRSATVVLLDRTTVVADERGSPRQKPPSVGRSGIDAFREGIVAARPMPGTTGPAPADAIPARTIRDELVASFVARNSESHAVPRPSIPEVTFMAFGTQPSTIAEQAAGGVNYTVVSLPGYASSGHALVYAFHDCGGRCGTAWMFLLERRDGRWQVLSRYVAGMF